VWSVFRWLIARTVRKRFAEMSQGEFGAVLRVLAEDAHFQYNGRHALAADLHHKAEIAAWFERTWTMLEIVFEVHDVVVAGPLWNMRIATRFTAQVRTVDGQCFINRGMQYARIRRGKVTEDCIYPDTQVVAQAIDHATHAGWRVGVRGCSQV
jgi:ketosteroid isomerase-like protein